MGPFRGVTGEDSSLDSCTISDGFIRVNTLDGFFPVEEIGDELRNTGDASGTTDQDDIVNVSLVDFGVPQNLPNRL